MVIKSEKTLASFAAPTQAKSSMRQALPQILAVCVKNVLLLGFGMTLGFPTILIPSLSGNDPDEIFTLDQESISWIGSINLICVPVGCLLSGVITQPIGRKRAMQFVNIPFLTAWLVFHFSTEVWHVFLALCLTGLTGGLLEAPVLTYVAEITQPHLRGMLSATSNAAIILGILFSFLIGTFHHWRTVALINIFVPILATILLFFVPETPVWLISKNRHLDAKKSLAWLRGWTSLDDIEHEYLEVCKHMGKASDPGIVTSKSDDSLEGLPMLPPPGLSKLEKLKLFTRRDFIHPFLLVSFSFFLCHFNGMSTLQTYAIEIFSTLKSPIDEYYATIILGVVEFLGCITCVSLVRIIGKRRICFVTMITCGICFLIVAVYAWVTDVHYLTSFDRPSVGGHSTTTAEVTGNDWLPMTFLILSAYLAQAGVRIIPWVLVGEVFSNDCRAMGSGLCAAIGYVFGFVTNKIFLSVVAGITLPGTFWLYTGINFLGVIGFYFFLPETEGKTLKEINEHFKGISKLGNNIRKRNVKSKVEESNGETNGGFKESNGDLGEGRF